MTHSSSSQEQMRQILNKIFNLFSVIARKLDTVFIEDVKVAEKSEDAVIEILVGFTDTTISVDLDELYESCKEYAISVESEYIEPGMCYEPCVIDDDDDEDYDDDDDDYYYSSRYDYDDDYYVYVPRIIRRCGPGCVRCEIEGYKEYCAACYGDVHGDGCAAFDECIRDEGERVEQQCGKGIPNIDKTLRNIGPIKSLTVRTEKIYMNNISPRDFFNNIDLVFEKDEYYCSFGVHVTAEVSKDALKNNDEIKRILQIIIDNAIYPVLSLIRERESPKDGQSPASTANN